MIPVLFLLHNHRYCSALPGTHFTGGQFSGLNPILFYTRAVFGRFADPGRLPDKEPPDSATFFPVTTLILGFVTISVACRASQAQFCLESEDHTVFVCASCGGSRRGAAFVWHGAQYGLPAPLYWLDAFVL
jgi:hypothetical protein